MTKTPRTLAAATILAVLTIAGCGSDSKSSSTTAAQAETTAAPAAGAGETTAAANPETTLGSTAAGGATLAIKGFAFGQLTAATGETITVTNGDSSRHTVTADDGTFDVKVPAGKSATFTVDKPGTYAIHCEVHPRMKGTITIT